MQYLSPYQRYSDMREYYCLYEPSYLVDPAKARCLAQADTKAKAVSIRDTAWGNAVLVRERAVQTGPRSWRVTSRKIILDET